MSCLCVVGIRLEAGGARERRAKRWVGKIVLVGDSAHAMSPFLGQGANQAFMDVALLCDNLSKYPLRQALDYYAATRKPVVDQIMEGSELVGLFNTAAGEAARVRDEVMYGIIACGAIRVKFPWWNPISMFAGVYLWYLSRRFLGAERGGVA